MPKSKYKRRTFTEKQLVERRAKRDADREAATQYGNPAQVITVEQWARLSNFSHSTARRILFEQQNGPPLLRISKRRYGIRLADHFAWQQRLVEAAS